MNGQLKPGNSVSLNGWVDARRDHGKIIFIDLRGSFGSVQCVFTPRQKEAYAIADTLRPEWVVNIQGIVKERPDNMKNPNIKTGDIEIEAANVAVVNKARIPPFALDTDGRDVNEELRLEYRYLDLRRKRLKENIIARDRALSFIRDFLHKKDFVEIETPILSKSTPEGARDYVVPYRKSPGRFYALPQSPQQYKQLLMIAGFEKYFQIARCMRDEDTRGGRQPEFTQLDIEMSFVTREDIMALLEALFAALIKECYPEKTITETPWPRISYADTMKTHKTDRPDLRKDTNNPNELAFAWIVDFPLFEPEKENGHYAPSHHMFTQPKKDDIPKLDTDPHAVQSHQVDLVLNGSEIAGGGMRIHKRDLQEKIFGLIGFTKTQQERFHHMLAAFEYGAPPHGGIAVGLDRFLMILRNEPNIREVIAFPKTGEGEDPMMKTPSALDKEQLEELGIQIKKSKV